jgi:hypothetical protein
MAKRKNNAIPYLRGVTTADDLKTIYAAAREQFTAADLQRYTEIEEGVPAEQVLTDLEAIDRQKSQRKKGRKRKTT